MRHHRGRRHAEGYAARPGDVSLACSRADLDPLLRIEPKEVQDLSRCAMVDLS